jgi:hypothetical protein
MRSTWIANAALLLAACLLCTSVIAQSTYRR